MTVKMNEVFAADFYQFIVEATLGNLGIRLLRPFRLYLGHL